MLLDVMGVLGFILSIVIFIITRLERRKTLVLDLECIDYGLSQNFENEIGEGKLYKTRLKYNLLLAVSAIEKGNM